MAPESSRYSTAESPSIGHATGDNSNPICSPSNFTEASTARWARLHQLIDLGYDRIWSDPGVEEEIKTLLAYLSNLPRQQHTCAVFEYLFEAFSCSFDCKLADFKICRKQYKSYEPALYDHLHKSEELHHAKHVLEDYRADDHTTLQAFINQQKLVKRLTASCHRLAIRVVNTCPGLCELVDTMVKLEMDLGNFAHIMRKHFGDSIPRN